MSKLNKLQKIWLIVGLFILGILLGFAIGALGLSLKPATIKTQAVVSISDTSQKLQIGEANYGSSVKILEEVNGVKLKDAPTMGNTQEAKVIIIEFADYQCPYCKKYFDQSFKKIIDTYVKTGKVLYAFRDYPLESHPQSLIAAYAADCAYEQGKFWEMHDMLYQENDKWINNDNAKNIFYQFAEKIGLNLTQFKQCLDEERPLFKVQQDIKDGQQYKVAGTPTFFINNQKLMGAQDFQKTFVPLIEEELSKPQPKSTQSEQVID